MSRRRLLVAAVVLAAAAAAGSIAATRSSGVQGVSSGPHRLAAVRIDPSGRIGPLQMNRSGEAQVVAYAGKPALLRVAKAGGRELYEVLGYGCLRRAATERHWDESPVECRTAFYLVDGRLSLFFTHDQRFSAGGVRVGTPTKRAERLLHQRALSGCTDAIRLQGKRAWMTVSLAGGKLHIAGTNHYLAGGHVDAFYLHGRRNTGATDCD